MAQRRARTDDRDAAVEILNTAYAEGQLTSAEHGARLTRALKARTIAQLERLTLDLQQPTPHLAAPTEGAPPQLRDQLRQNVADQRNQWSNVPRWQKILIGVIATGSIGGLGAIAVIDDGPDDADSGIVAGAGTPALTAGALSAFVDTYEDQFDTTRVVAATFSEDEVVLRVPTKDGKARHVEWRYRDREFRKVQEARRNSDNQAPIDLTDIDFARLEKNITTAKARLDVEQPDSILVWIERDYREKRPSVRIQVGNRFQEVGMYVTDLAGRTVFYESPFTPSTP